MFDSAIPPNQEALLKSGYMYPLKYNPQPPKPKHFRRRSIIWFDPPYSANVATSIGHKFLQAINECFPQSHLLHKILNRNTLPQTNTTDANKECNCCQNVSYPLSGKCLTESVVYQATVMIEDTKEKKTNVGHMRGQFKTRYNYHTNSFRNAKHKHATALSNYVWFLKESNVQYSINWNIIKKCKSYSNKTK